MNCSRLIRLLPTFMFCITAACSSDSNTQQDTSNRSDPSNSTGSVEPPAQGARVGAFLRGAAPDEAAAKAFEQGMQLAAGEKSPPPAVLTVHERVQGTPDTPAFKSMAKDGKASVLVYWQTSDIAPAAPTLKDLPVLGIPVWNVTEKVTGLGTNIFGFGYSTERSFAQFAKFAGNNLKSYRFGVISSSASPFDTQTEAFIEETKSQGNTVVFDEKVDTDTNNFGALLTRATKENCDTIFAALPGNSLVALIKSARSGGYKGKILIGDSFFAPELTTLGADAEGIYLTQAWNDDPDFTSRYTAKYGGQPDGVTLGAAALGYDLIRCIENADSHADAGAIKHSWLSKPCEGLTGKTQFSGERIAQRQKRILTVKDGKFVAVG